MSYDVARSDQTLLATFSEAERLALQGGNGWYPIVLADGQRGFVARRYVNPLQQDQVIFKRSEGRWRLIVIPSAAY